MAAGKAPRVELGFGLDLIGGMNPRRQRREGGPGYCVPRTQRSDWTMIQIFAYGINRTEGSFQAKAARSVAGSVKEQVGAGGRGTRSRPGNPLLRRRCTEGRQAPRPGLEMPPRLSARAATSRMASPALPPHRRQLCSCRRPAIHPQPTPRSWFPLSFSIVCSSESAPCHGLPGVQGKETFIFTFPFGKTQLRTSNELLLREEWLGRDISFQ